MSHSQERRDHYYERITVTALEFTDSPDVKLSFTILNGGMMIMNDSDEIISFSFNGEDIDGEIEPNDKWWAMDRLKQSRIWFKTTTPGSKIRLVAWI